MRRSPLLAALLSCLWLAPAPAVAQTVKPPTAKPKPKGGAPTPTFSGTPTPPQAAPPATPSTKPSPPPEVFPPPPPPWTSPAPPTISTSGATLLPANPTPAPPPPPPDLALVQGPTNAALEARVSTLEARLSAAESENAATITKLDWLKRFKLTGFVQPQLLIQSYNTAASPNLTATGVLPPNVGANDTTAKPNGATTNGTFFRLRRARLKTEFMPVDGARFVFEIDPTPAGGSIGGIGSVARNVEAVGIARWSDVVSTDFAVGIFKIPFGYEVLQSDADRPFIERSWGEQNMTPGEFDTGARAYTTWKKGAHTFVFQLAIVNGQTQGEPTFSLVPDLNRGKDAVGRMNFDFGDWADLGVSGYVGTGQSVDAVGLRFKQFIRAAGNFELGLHHTFSPKVGATKLLGEITYGQNMDRGVKYGFAVPAITSPITTGVKNLTELSAWVRLEQDLTEWVTLGLRWDEYTPDLSFGDNARNTFGAVGVVHFNKWLQAMLEFDHAMDHVHASSKPVPDRQIDMGSGVLQARF